MLEDFGSPEALVADTSLSLAQVRLAVAYRNAGSPDPRVGGVRAGSLVASG